MTDSSSLPNDRRVAYFSMEIALRPDLPTYAGGLGVLAGDMLRSAADLGVPIVGVTLVYRKGYFRQRLDSQGNQQEEPVIWKPEEALEPMTPVVSLELAGRRVQIRAWRFTLTGISGATVPVYLLDTDLPENDPADRSLTDYLYGGDPSYRLHQEAILGMGGVKMLNSLGHTGIENYHLNEGHSALLTLTLLEQRIGSSHLGTATEADIEAVRHRCVFTTHTPVPAAFDKFPRDLVNQVIGPDRAAVLDVTKCCQEGMLNMTYLALRFSHYINGVAMHHGEVSRGLFPNYPVRAITNGVHAVTWTSPQFQEVFRPACAGMAQGQPVSALRRGRAAGRNPAGSRRRQAGSARRTEASHRRRVRSRRSDHRVRAARRGLQTRRSFVHGPGTPEIHRRDTLGRCK